MSEPAGHQITAATMFAAVIGSPIKHSLSPILHNAAFRATGLDWVYGAFDVAADEAASAVDAMRTLGLGGLNVTMPCKEAVVGALDDLSPDAAALRAVNCVRREGSRLVGENFDGQGFVRSLADVEVDPSGCRVALIGAGGAARAVGVALARSGAAQIAVVNRSAARANLAVATIGDVAIVGSGDHIATADLVVDTTPLGMAADDPVAFDVDQLNAEQTVADLIYHPPETRLLTEAAARGCRTLNGLGMLLHQAALAFTAWTGAEAPVGAMRNALNDAIATR